MLITEFDLINRFCGSVISYRINDVDDLTDTY